VTVAVAVSNAGEVGVDVQQVEDVEIVLVEGVGNGDDRQHGLLICRGALCLIERSGAARRR
jgi:hypothetical protein